MLSSLSATRPQRRSARRAAGSGTDQPEGRGAGGSGRSPRSTAQPTKVGTQSQANPPGGKAKPRTKPPRAAGSRGPEAATGPSPSAKAAPRKPTAVRPSAATRRARESGPRARTGPTAAPPAPEGRPMEGLELVNTTVQAAGELAQIGLSLSARALRGAISRLPRP